MSKIFISYNRDSIAMARSLVNDIESLGFVVWFDQELSGGQAWWDQILAMVRECDVFVFLLDPKALNSTACQREFGYAADLDKPILPVLVAEGVSTNLLPPAKPLPARSRYHWNRRCDYGSDHWDGQEGHPYRVSWTCSWLWYFGDCDP